jgi:hypothetical protein
MQVFCENKLDLRMASFFKEQNLIAKWYNVPVEAYKVAYDLAKERFDEIVAENESITNKSMKILTAFLLYVGFFIGLISKDFSIIIKDNCKMLCLFIGVIGVFWVSYTLLQLMLPKEIRMRGMKPSVSIPKDFDDKEDEAHLEQKIYYNILCVLQDNISRMETLQGERAVNYENALLSSLALFVYIPAITVYVLL